MELKLEKIKEILKKDQDSRNSDDIKLLSSIISSIKFFESLKNYKLVLRECCMYLVYELVPKKSFVFKQGEYGDKFYILIKGEVSVQVTVKEDTKTVTKEVLTYKDGASFGELALTDKKPRAASILTKVDCHFAVLDKFNYNRILSSLISSQRTEFIDFLKHQSYFKHLTKVSLLKLSYCFEEKQMKKGELLFNEGDPIEFIFCIREGEVKLSKKVKIEMIGDTKPITKGTLILKKHCWKKVDVGILEKGELLGVNDIEKKVFNSTCVVNSKTAKILQVSLGHFLKRMDNEDTLNVINNGKTMRNLLHQKNVNSATKILRERIASPYKKLLFEETFSVPATNEKSRKTELFIKSKRNSESMEIDPRESKFASFDCTLNRKEEFAESKRRVKTALQNYRNIPKTTPVDRDRTPKWKSQSMSVNKNYDQESSPKSQSITRKKYNLRFIMTKMSPFGKNKTITPQVKEEETVNIHTKQKKDLSLRPNTPKNWSFMNISNSIRRPISIDAKRRPSLS